MEFRINAHEITGEPMVEGWQNNEYIAGIYSYGDGLKIVSKHLDGVTHKSGMPPSLIINFSLPAEGGSGE